MTDSVTHHLFERVIQRIDPAYKLLRAGSLMGGFSAQVTAVEIVRPDGQKQMLLVRQHGELDRTHNPHIAADEYKLLHITHRAGLPTPRPCTLDESCAILSVPYIVLEYIDGATVFEPANVTDYIQQFAMTLARIHRVDVARYDLAFLPTQTDSIAQNLRQQAAELDATLDESRVRETLAAAWPLPQVNPPVLLHGDYWPGNLLWADGQLVGVIDWEDARVGDPVADVARSRLELWWALGVDAMQQFTAVYQSLTTVDFTHLPYWDLCAALRHIGKVEGWGLDADTLNRMRQQQRQFIQQALQAIVERHE